LDHDERDTPAGYLNSVSAAELVRREPLPNSSRPSRVA
jgi:hypothetical protein